MIVEITHYYRPNGRRKIECTELPDKHQKQYETMQENGCNFAAEVLTNNMVSSTIENDEEDLAIRVTVNGPEVQAAMIEMLNELYPEV